MGTPIVIAKNLNDTSKEIVLLSQFANRHGLIAGATGTGKTVTLKVLAESFSRIGVPVFLADAKGDVSSLAKSGEASDKFNERLKLLQIDSVPFAANPVVSGIYSANKAILFALLFLRLGQFYWLVCSI